MLELPLPGEPEQSARLPVLAVLGHASPASRPGSDVLALLFRQVAGGRWQVGRVGVVTLIGRQLSSSCRPPSRSAPRRAA